MVPSARTSLTSTTRPDGVSATDPEQPGAEPMRPAPGFATRAVRVGHHRTAEGEHGEPIFTTSMEARMGMPVEVSVTPRDSIMAR